MSLNPPPLTEQVSDESGVATLAWTLFFNQSYQGDKGNAWTPTFQNLTISGTPSITGRYYKFSDELAYFRVLIVPATNTSATAGSTYIDNFPLVLTNDGPCFAVSGNVGSTPGMCNASNNRIYVPSWSTVTVPLTITGTVEAR